MWSQLHRAILFSSRPATPVSEANCHDKRTEDATRAALMCKQGPPHVSCRVGDVDNVTMLKKNIHRQQKIHLHCYTGDLPSYNNWIGMFPNTVFGVTMKTTQMPGYAYLARQMELGRLVLETDSPVLPRGSGRPCDVAGHVTSVAKYRNLPAWVVLRVTALNAKGFYEV